MGWRQLFEPEETVGTLWHNMASRLGDASPNSEAAIQLADIRSSLAVLFRALGGARDVEITEAVPEKIKHKRTILRRLSHGSELGSRPSFDGDRLCLPAAIGIFDTTSLNKTAYLWLTASAALFRFSNATAPSVDAGPTVLDRFYLQQNVRMTDIVLSTCPGLSNGFEQMLNAVSDHPGAPATDSPGMEGEIGAFIRGQEVDVNLAVDAESSVRIPPLPFWLDFVGKAATGVAAGEDEQDTTTSAATSRASRKPRRGERRDLDEANRTDSFIMHRFETILSWAESMDINRKVESDDDENAQKAADDMDSLTLSKHRKSIASRLNLHLELSPAEVEHERLSGKFTYPEWNCRKQVYMPDHCRVLEAVGKSKENAMVNHDRRAIEQVRRQFEALSTRRMLLPRQIDGAELDLDALMDSIIDMRATGRGSDRCYIDSRISQRDICVALLLDTSRSTESDMGGTSIIDVARDALITLAHGLDACGDRFGIWGFSSLKRNRVFVTRCKNFDTPMSGLVDRRIASLRPGHHTRLGAAIRHVTAQLAKETSAQKLVIVLTDGKPNDVDHYEGKHGIEDSRMAVKEARRDSMVVHGVVIDEDGQDWFARIFDPRGFTLLPRPQRLAKALPEIYRSLTQEY